MNKAKIGDFIEEYGDGIHGTPNYIDKSSYYFINGNNLVNGKIQITNDTLMISEEEYEKIKRPLSCNTLLLSINGTLGRVGVYDGENIALGKSVCYLNIKENKNKYFIKYVLNSLEFQKYIQLVAHGSTIKNLAPSQVIEYEFDVPSDETQRKIALLLKEIDDKIDNNNSINMELESMAKTIYDYWFLQFDFPDENGKPYKSSGGKMVWNEQLKKEIPDGWQVKKLEKLCSFSNGINYDKNKDGNKYYKIVNVRNITASSLLLDSSAFDVINLLSSQAERYIVKPYDILIARSGTPGAIRLLFSNEKDIIYCGFIIKCSPNEKKQRLFLAYTLKNLEGSSATKTGGSIMQNVSQDTLKQVNICLPLDELIDQFNEIIYPMINKMQEIILENQELSSLRDFLLPLLMNGQIGFKD